MAAAGFIVRIGLMSSKLWYVALDDRDIALQVARDAARDDAAYADIQIVGELATPPR
jgi:hypothetical protein